MKPGKPDFNYLPFKVHGGIIYLAGQLAKEDGLVKNTGQVLEEISEFEASRQMKLCAEHACSWLKIAAEKNKEFIIVLINIREICYELQKN